jgi:hypothetical protein
VTLNENEPPRMRADLLVLVDRQLDHLIAREPGAFAPKPDPGVALARPRAARDRLVDLAKRRLVRRHPALNLIVHDTILPD